MHEKFFNRLLDNHNPEVFLPQNLPNTLLHLLVNEDTEESSTILIHAVSVMYRSLYNIPQRGNIRVESSLFKSCIRKYAIFLVNEQDFRLNCISEQELPTVADILNSNY